MRSLGLRITTYQRDIYAVPEDKKVYAEKNLSKISKLLKRSDNDLDTIFTTVVFVSTAVSDLIF